jgi:hypothetical protein
MKKSENQVKILTKLVDGEQVFSTFDILKILDIKRGRFVQWQKAKYLPEGTKVEWGSRTKTVFSIYSLYRIALFKLLVDMGLNRDLSSKYAFQIDFDKIKSSKERYMIIIKSKGEYQKLQFETEEQLKNLSKYESALCLNLKKVVENVDIRV